MHASESCRIAVTGIGLSTPLGPDRETSWKAILAGRSAVRWLSHPHWTDSSRMAGAPSCLAACEKSDRDPIIQLALSTAAEALADAGLDRSTLPRTSTGVVFGTSKGGLHTFARLFQDHRSREGDRAQSSRPNSDDWLDVFPNQPAVDIARTIGARGPVLCPIAACATGLAACIRAAELIRNGDCDLVLAGSADASLQPALLGSFRRLGVLSREMTDPSVACRPFDASRSGFVIGEGSACLILERLESALSRNAHIYAEWMDGRMLSDPRGLTQLDLDGTSLKRLLSDLWQRSRSMPDYINLHGTGTSSNDLVECRAVRDVFGTSTDTFRCSSLKGGIGHLLGAAGSVELAATVLAIRDQIAPPTANLYHVDPECRLSLTPLQAEPRRIDHAWKVSMGFGGHIAGAWLRRFSDSSSSP